MSTNPLHTVIGEDAKTHLIVRSPALPGTGFNRKPALAICGEPNMAPSATAPGDVECTACLELAPRYMRFPGYEITR